MYSKPDDIWKDSVKQLRTVFPPETINLWFTGTKAISFDNNVLAINVPNKYFSDWMRKHSTQITAALRISSQTDEISVIYNINPGESAYVSQSRVNIPDPTYQPDNEVYFPETILNPRYTFESFIIGSSNRFAQAASEAVANEPGIRYNPLFIYGGVGLGKTHLLHAIGHRAKLNKPNSRILYLTCDKFTQEVIDSIKNNTMSDFKKKYTTISMLLLDDIQFLEGKEKTQEEFFNIFNTLYELDKQVVLSSDNPPSKIKTLQDRLSSRFEWGVITDIQPPDLETRIAILKSKAERENIDVPYEVLLYIASNIKENIRKLEGALIRIFAFSSLTGSELVVDNAKEILKDIIGSEEKAIPISVDDIIEVVSGYYHVSTKEIKGAKRLKTIVFPRHLSMYLSRKLTEKSTTEIGRNFGNRDHTTVMYASKTIVKKLEEDSIFQSIVDKLINDVKSGS